MTVQCGTETWRTPLSSSFSQPMLKENVQVVALSQIFEKLLLLLCKKSIQKKYLSPTIKIQNGSATAEVCRFSRCL
jgi:hypothetical protein